MARFKSQLKALGLSFDWDREINTTDPEYYKWTQWIFLQLLRTALPTKRKMAVNWCTSCKVVFLRTRRSSMASVSAAAGPKVRKNKSQWMLKITEYAQRLIDDLTTVDYRPDRVKPSSQLDRPPTAPRSTSTPPRGSLTVYTTRAGHAVRCDLHGHQPRSTPSSKMGRRGPDPEMDAVAAYQEEAARKKIRLRAHRAEQGKDRRCHGGRQGHQPGQRQGRSPSSSPTMFSCPTAPARSWLFPPTTTATGSSPKNSV